MSTINLPSIEDEIFKFWEDNQIFQATLNESKDRPLFNFYDGPPFATGSPHYGHLLAATIKDTVCRFQTINGKHVPRINGFDDHGLPIEQLGEKTLGIKSTDEIFKMGIAKFNETCCSLVNSCAKDWERVIPRMGRWVDFKNGYQTMDFEFMNAVWGVFKTIFDKGLVYRSLTPMPYSTGCGTCLSHFEAKSNYQDTQDPSVVIKFRLNEEQSKFIELKGESNSASISFLVWTTTPYSLTANLAVCVNKKIQYCLVKSQSQKNDVDEIKEVIPVDEYYIIAKESIKTWEQKTNKFVIMKEFLGDYLVGIEYHPPFTFNNDLKMKNIQSKIFTVLEDSYVKVDAGTGIVHLAPGMGEDDFRVCQREEIINPHIIDSIPCPIDEKGCLMVGNYVGQYVKVADKQIIKDLKNLGLVWESKTISHSYPFCYRSDTPLIQKTISSWFIDVKSINDKILALNKEINWIPTNVGEARFAQWLSSPRDWSFGRNRFWGTPVPLWVNEDFTEIICVSSTKELENLAGLVEGSITNLHREFIDHIKIPSIKNPGTYLTRITDVFDCWFESGSVPYGKFAVENKYKGTEIYDILSGKNQDLRETFMKYFPADFIGEGLDQTRGWFYTLLVLSTILFEERAYKNVIVNGLILSADPTATGKWIKMSKRYKNYPNPEEVVYKYGADSLRLYLLDSPVTHSEPLKFQEEGIQQKARFVVQLMNCYQLLESEIKLFLLNNKMDKFTLCESTQIYDQWILGKLKEVIEKSMKYYSEFKLYLVVPILVEFEELFSKWYINLSKENMKGFHGKDIQKQSLSTLWKLLKIYSILISPIAPFISENIYKEMHKYMDINILCKESIHMELLENHANTLVFDPIISEKVSNMVDVVMSFRGLKAGAGIGTRMKSKEVYLKHQSQKFLDNVNELESELLTAIKVDKIYYQILDLNNQTDLSIKINTQVLGQLLKRDLMPVLDILKTMQPSEFIGKDSIICKGHTINSDSWTLVPNLSQASDYLIDYTSNGLLIQLSKEIITSPLEDQMELMIKNIQKAKKEANIKPYQIVDIFINILNTELNVMVTEEYDNIIERLRSNIHLNTTCSENDQHKHIYISQFKNDYYDFTIILNN
jgi:isoleucyl-tRNA synthetase